MNRPTPGPSQEGNSSSVPDIAPLLRRGWGWVHGPNSRPIFLEEFATYEPGGARLRRALISIHWRSGLGGVSPHHSWSQCVRKSERKLPMKPEEHPTSDIQRRTSNGSANPRSLRRSMFDVGRSMFSIGSGVSTREFSFRGISSDKVRVVGNLADRTR